MKDFELSVSVSLLHPITGVRVPLNLTDTQRTQIEREVNRIMFKVTPVAEVEAATKHEFLAKPKRRYRKSIHRVDWTADQLSKLDVLINKYSHLEKHAQHPVKTAELREFAKETGRSVPAINARISQRRRELEKKRAESQFGRSVIELPNRIRVN